tara:strand:- start:250 stop:495 length:246 start_codon:yes stop_codon:yes gene_type:complete
MENNPSTTVNSKKVLQKPVKEPVKEQPTPYTEPDKEPNKEPDKEHNTLYIEPDDGDMFYINEYWSGRPGKPRYYDVNGDEI